MVAATWTCQPVRVGWQGLKVIVNKGRSDQRLPSPDELLRKRNQSTHGSRIVKKSVSVVGAVEQMTTHATGRDPMMRVRLLDHVFFVVPMMMTTNWDHSAGHRSVRFEEPPPPVPKAFDTLEAPRGPLSGVVKLVDTAHLMTRLHENEIKMKQMEEERKANELAAQTAPVAAPQPPPAQYTRRSSAAVVPVARQVSEDEIEKQKKENKAAAAAEKATETAKAVTTATAKESVAAPTATAPASRLTTASSVESRYVPRRVTALREDSDDTPPVRRTSSSDRPEITSLDRPPSGREAVTRRESRDDSRDDDDDDSVVARYRRRKEMTSVPPPPVVAAAPSTTTSSSRQVSGLKCVPSASSIPVSNATPPASSVTNGSSNSSRFLRDVHEDSDSDSDNSALPPLSQYARTRNSETAYSPMNTASFSMRRGSTTDLPPTTPPATTTTPPTTPSATTASVRTSSLLTRTPSLDQESDSRTGVSNSRESAASAITSAHPKIVPLSLRRRESSPLLLRQATMPVTASDKSAVFVKRDSFTSLRSRSPSADREASKSTTNLDSYRTSTQYTPPTTPTRRTNYDSGREFSGSRYSSSRTAGLSSLPYSSSNSGSSAPRSTGLARSSTVGDMLSRSSRYTGSDRDTGSSYHSSSARDPFSRRDSPSSTSYTSSSSTPSSRQVSSSSSSYRRPSMSSSLSLTDATSNMRHMYRSVTRAFSLFFSSLFSCHRKKCTDLYAGRRAALDRTRAYR